MREVTTHLIARRRVRARMRIASSAQRSDLLKVEFASLRSGDFDHGLPKPERASKSAPYVREVPRSPLKRKHRLRLRRKGTGAE